MRVVIGIFIIREWPYMLVFSSSIVVLLISMNPDFPKEIPLK